MSLVRIVHSHPHVRVGHLLLGYGFDPLQHGGPPQFEYLVGVAVGDELYQRSYKLFPTSSKLFAKGWAYLVAVGCFLTADLRNLKNFSTGLSHGEYCAEKRRMTLKRSTVSITLRWWWIEALSMSSTTLLPMNSGLSRTYTSSL